MTTGSWFTVLGPVRAWHADAELDLGSPQQRSVLAVLLLRRGTPVSIEDMIDALWDEDVPGAAASTVRTYISRLRQVLAQGAPAGPAIRSVTGGYQLDLADEGLDLTVFQRHVADAERARLAGDAATWARELVTGLELWHGTPLSGLPGPFASRQRASLERLRASTQKTRLRAQLDLGELDHLLPELAALAEEHPLDEQLQELLITGLYRAGRQADALAAYQGTRTLLASELGIDPGPALRALHERILRADPALMPAAGAGSSGSAAGQAPPPSLRPLEGPGPLTNLPTPVSSFIGRAAELAAVRTLVAGSRLVTLIGVGGAGKTRLALQVAAGLPADGAGDGVWFADLAPLRDPELVAVTVADVLGVQLKPGLPVPEALAETVGALSMLVLLDNCEHVISACAKLADVLLRGCPNITLLATSREPLGIDGEQVYRVPSMGVPADDADAEEIRASEAVRLLADRAAAQGAALAWHEQTAQVAGRICGRLDGIPLAIELAAARLRVMSAAELDARLDERFALLTGGSRTALPRQQTLRAMADWSWELLIGPEQEVLARLSVFAGSFGLDAAEAVAAHPALPAAEVLTHLGGLVDKSLVQFGDIGTGPGRYRLLETIRQYAAAQLDAQGPAAASAVQAVHRDYYLALAEAAGPQLRGADQARWMDRLDAELGNLRAALAFSQAQADPDPGLRLAASLRVYWLARGHAAEAAGVLRALLDTPAAQGVKLSRAQALAAAANLVEQTGGYAVADKYCQEALPIARAAGDDYLVAELLNEQAWVLLRQGQPGALTLIESGLSLARHLQEPGVITLLLSNRTVALAYEDDIAGAVRAATESLQFSRQTSDQRLVGHTLGNLGACELSAGDLDAARRHLRESLDIARTLNDRYGLLVQLHNLGLAEYLGGSPDAAEPLFAETLDLARRMGMKVNMAYALLGLALAGHSGTDPEWSARLHGAADQALADLGHTLEPLEARLADRDRQRLRDAMGTGAFDAEYADGRALDPAQVLVAIGRNVPCRPAHHTSVPLTGRPSAPGAA